MANDTLYFYDLETSGLNARKARIMQFAGQRTTLDLEPIGQPDNILIKMTDDIVPDPRAILVTGITPQQTQADGITEKAFCDYFTSTIATPHTTILGYNSLRFDNEFLRFMFYRNFYDAYEWSYANGRSVWDMLDVVRMTRALRPDGIQWPFAADGTPTNSLEKLTSVNNIAHANAHDALADVQATIAVARIIKQKQPKLFSFLFKTRTKQAVQDIVNAGKPFVYTTGRYDAAYHKTSVAIRIADHPVYGAGRALVYDLRHDPTEFMHLSTPDLLDRLAYTKDTEAPARLPVKELTYNKCPAVAPLQVLTPEAADNISIDTATIHRHLQQLQTDPTFIDRVRQAFEDMHEERQTELVTNIVGVDTQLYDGFLNEADKKQCAMVRASNKDTIVDLHPSFYDERLAPLLLLYKARQFPGSLSEDEQKAWEAYRHTKLYAADTSALTLPAYFSSIQSLAASASAHDKAILEDLWLWGESIMPEGDAEDL
jgi:exodeoxyribonuclease-1